MQCMHYKKRHTYGVYTPKACMYRSPERAHTCNPRRPKDVAHRLNEMSLSSSNTSFKPGIPQASRLHVPWPAVKPAMDDCSLHHCWRAKALWNHRNVRSNLMQTIPSVLHCVSQLATQPHAYSPRTTSCTVHARCILPCTLSFISWWLMPVQQLLFFYT